MNIESKDGLKVFDVNVDHALGTWNDVIFYVWKQNTTPQAISTIKSMFRSVNPTRNFLFGVVEAGAPMPSSEMRRELAAVMTDERSKGRVCSALVFEGTGFQASAVRMVATGLALLAKQSYPHHVFDSIGEAAKWLRSEAAQRAIPTAEFAGLEEAMQRLRASPGTRG